MNTFTATMIAEGQFELAGVELENAEEAEALIIEAYQTLIDSGLVWQLQGYFGRRAQQLIDEGICHA